MSTTPHSLELLRSLGPLKLLNLTKTDQGWIVEAEGRNSAVGPSCQTQSRSRHSRYGRSLRDLPIQGAAVILKLVKNAHRSKTVKVLSGALYTLLHRTRHYCRVVVYEWNGFPLFSMFSTFEYNDSLH